MEQEGDGGIKFRFPPPQRSGQKVAVLDGVSKTYGDLKVFEGFDFEIDRGDHIAVVGVNGAGKSTFSRIVAGKEPLTAGACKLGHNVAVSHIAQNHAEELDSGKTVL